MSSLSTIYSISSRILTPRCSRFLIPQLSHKFYNSAAPATKEELHGPEVEGQPKKSYPPHIRSIVDNISKLTLIEVSDLNELLKSELKIQGGAMMPMMSPGMMMSQPNVDEEEAGEENAVKNSFNVKLIKFDTGKKVALIKEVKGLVPEMNLVQAKKFVESCPDFVVKDVSKEDAEKYKTTLEAVGGTVEIE